MCYSEKGGSSFWFMTASQTAPEVADYFQSELGQELDWEGHVATVNELARAPFPVYIGEQKLGDLILVPPRSCHQVVNYGGLTMKISWSRMTVRGLGIALHYELPIYRRYVIVHLTDHLDSNRIQGMSSRTIPSEISPLSIATVLH